MAYPYHCMTNAESKEKEGGFLPNQGTWIFMLLFQNLLGCHQRNAVRTIQLGV